jgi:hypothetical protein
MMTELEAKKLLYVLESAYPRAEFAAGTAQLYAQMLGDLPYEVAKTAVMRLIATSKWLPTIAEIRQMCAETVNPLLSAEDAWIEACKAARAFTPYQAPPELQMALRGHVRGTADMSPLTRKAVQVLGGIEAIAYSGQPEFMGREFRRVYERLRESEIRNRQQGRMQITESGLPVGLLGGGSERWLH